ncbi:MAG: hypothetical protein CL907_00115 [Dehalococcoidia bacterium]|nr:hypothetical protein [Dehalococcoidia bacterium]|tara:strand:- start:9553 stop:10437 length:885 start_codon:yes stop_codon:yes gene_type:complete
MRILVTGITGFIGKNYYEFGSDDNKILALSREESIKKYDLFNNLNFLNCDLDNFYNFSDQIIDFNPDCVLNMAWQGIPDYSYENSIKNLNMTLNFFEFLSNKTNIKKFINTGTCAEYLNPVGKISEEYAIEPYDDFSKAKINLSETLIAKCDEIGINYVNLRLFYVYGFYQRKKSLIPYLIDSYKKGIVPEISKPFSGLDFIFAEDVITAIDSCVYNQIPSGSYNVGSGKVIYNLDIQKIISDNLNYEFDFNLYPKDNNYESFFADISKINYFTNWSPKFNINEGIAKILKKDI